MKRGIIVAIVLIIAIGAIAYVLKNNKQKNKMTFVSDNPSYQPYTVNSDDVLEVWQAQMIISKANTQQRWDVNQLAGLVNNLQQQVSVLKKRMN